MHNKVLGDTCQRKDICVHGRRAAGWTHTQQQRQGFVALLRDHPFMETSGRITFIVFVEAGLSGQQWYHSSVDLSSAPLTFDYVLALKRRQNKSLGLALFSQSHLISNSSLG